MLTFSWLLFPFSFFLIWICVEIWSPLAFVCKMKMSKPECFVSLQTDHLLLTHCVGWCPRPLGDQSPFQKVRMLHPNHHPTTLNHQLQLPPAFYFAMLLKAAKSGTTPRVSEKREHMSIHYIFIHTLRHVLTPKTHTVCSDFLTPACFANFFSTPSIPLFHFISILFKGNAAVNWKR